MPTPLPPGQRERPDFPRFGLLPFATRFPGQTDRIDLHVSFPDSGGSAPGPAPTPAHNPAALTTGVDAQLGQLARVEQTSDFHCVTNWTRRGLRWGGVRFADFYEQIVVPLCASDRASGQAAIDPAAARFVVLRAQDGARTSLPLEDLLSPDVLLADHLDGLRFMVHPRARVALEERGPH